MKKGGNQFDAVSIGSATQDLFVFSKKLAVLKTGKYGSGYAECLELGSKNDVEELVTATGGGATNSAASFANLGYKTAICTELGDDDAGKSVKRELKELGIKDFSHVRAGKKTGLSIILSHAGFDRSILTYRGASSEISIGHFPLSKITTNWFYVTSLHGNIAGLRSIIDRAEETSSRVAWNPGGAELELGLKKLRPLLERIHLFILNREEAMQLTGVKSENVNDLLEKLCGIAEFTCITDGPNGAWLCTDVQAWHAKTTNIKTKNTTGAGDAFGSGLVAGFMEHGEPSQALKVAVVNSQSVIQHVGAKTGLLKKWPSAKELDEIRVVAW